MSIKTQKIIRFIPLINLVTMFLWTKSCLVNVVKIKDYIKDMFKIFVSIMLIVIARIFITHVINNQIVTNVLTYISVYLFTLSMSNVAVKAQEKMLINKN